MVDIGGGAGIASIVGMAFRFLHLGLGGIGKIVQMVSNIVIAALIALLAFSPFFGFDAFGLLTGNVFLLYAFFLAMGYAAASLIAELLHL